ncbi:hypothetical protein AFCA_008959 [Aspergillus flavus]|nr:hypothetical protein AFCA_008959 [Aspergillus flavus]
MSAPPNSKRVKASPSTSAPSHLLAPQQVNPFQRVPSYEGIPMPQSQLSPPNPKKRRASPQISTATTMSTSGTTAAAGEAALEPGPGVPEAPPRKKGRTNTPWTAEEEQRLKTMRDAGRSWSEIAKTFPFRTEGSVKKHWYKDMHYAEFDEDEVKFGASRKISFIILRLTACSP